MSYSQQQYKISKVDIERIVSHSAMATLDKKEAQAARDAILHARGEDEKISLRRIDEVLRRLESERCISVNDRRAIIKKFESHIAAK